MFFFVPDFHEQKKSHTNLSNMRKGVLPSNRILISKTNLKTAASSFTDQIFATVSCQKKNLCNGQVIPPFRRSFQTFTNRGKQRREFKNDFV